MIARLMLILSLILLVACGVPPQQATGDQPAASPSAIASPSAVASPSAAPPTAVTTTPPTPPAIPSTPTVAAVNPTALPTAAAVTPSSAPAIPATPTGTAEAILTGTISYPSKNLPADATLSVRLIGIPGIGSNVLGQQEFASVPPAPVALALPYNPTQIDPVEYPIIYVEAVIESKGLILFEHEPVAVLTPGKPTTAEITLLPTNRALISGMISYPADTALPADATLTVWLVKGPEIVAYGRAEQIITPVSSGATPFIVQSWANDNSPEPYKIYAALRGGGKLLAVTNQLQPVTLNEQRAMVDMELERPARVGVVSGTVSYPAGTVLPPDAVLKVELHDVSGVDGPSPLIGQQIIAPVGPGPIPFTVEYDQTLTNPTGVYAVSAQVSAGERLLLNNSMRYDVQLDSSAPYTIEMQPSP